MTPAAPRDRQQRIRDTLAKLTEPAADVWVATASGSEPYLVPLSLAWVDERAVIALDGTSRTARNLRTAGTARLAVGPTRDVVVLDVVLERAVPVADAGELGERYAGQADWDPRAAGGSYEFLVLRPERVQAWREADEIPGRTLMRDGSWLS
ncbi:MAG TPA: hypothetical protein VI357_19965 [Mycobacteriales bacterium]